MRDSPKSFLKILFSPLQLWRIFSDYFRLFGAHRLHAVTDRESLKTFIETRASFVAQTSLYGYLRTRAGMRYPELFDDDVFVRSINIAKWQIWLACLSDLSVYAGGLLSRSSRYQSATIRKLLLQVTDDILSETGIPQDAGPEFQKDATQIQERLHATSWQEFEDNEQVFTLSPRSLVDWAPIIDELKQLDEEIVINSVRFRWQKVRQDLRKALQAETLLASD